MCIIAYAPRGVEIKEETIRVMFRGNPDGAGIMWKPTDDSPVEIRKGFMTVEKLINAFNEIPTECEKAIHCRIATSGKVSAECCHPFPVRAKVSAMKQPRDTAYMALMHNGIIDYCEPRGGLQAKESDTMIFAATYLYPLQKLIDTAPIQTLIEESTTSRLLIFRKSAETLMFGDWKYEDGVYYSNSNYMPNAFANKYASRYSSYDDFDYYDKYYGNYNYGKTSATTAKTTVAQAELDDCTAKALEATEQFDGYGDYDETYETDNAIPEPVWYEIAVDADHELSADEKATVLDEIFDELAQYDTVIEIEELTFEPYKNGNFVYVVLYGSLPDNVFSLAGYKVLQRGVFDA